MVLMMCVLLATGLAFIYGSGVQLGGRFTGYWKRQVFWTVCGVIAFVTTAAIDYRRLAGVSWLFYAGANFILVSLFVVGKTVNQARSWLAVGSFTLQPSELAKPAVILFLAWLVTRAAFRFDRFLDIAIFVITLALPAFLVAQQPDWGTALVFVPIGCAMAFVGGLPWRYILGAGLIALVTLPLAYKVVLEERQRQRIHTFLNPSEDRSGAGYNAHQSLLAVGSGGVFGKGYMAGHQYKLGYLPRNVAPTDFIFSVIGEETGFLGSTMLVASLLGLIGCCLRTAAMAPDRLGTVICAGVVAFLFAHTYVNVGMTIGAAPIIGIPLPLVSYGGSFMVGTMAGLGLVQSVYARRHSRATV